MCKWIVLELIRAACFLAVPPRCVQSSVPAELSSPRPPSTSLPFTLTPSLHVPEETYLPQIMCEQGSQNPQRRVQPYNHVLQDTGHIVLQSASLTCREVCGVLHCICMPRSSAKIRHKHTNIRQTKNSPAKTPLIRRHCEGRDNMLLPCPCHSCMVCRWWSEKVLE